MGFVWNIETVKRWKIFENFEKFMAWISLRKIFLRRFMEMDVDSLRWIFKSLCKFFLLFPNFSKNSNSQTLTLILLSPASEVLNCNSRKQIWFYPGKIPVACYFLAGSQKYFQYYEKQYMNRWTKFGAPCIDFWDIMTTKNWSFRSFNCWISWF